MLNEVHADPAGTLKPHPGRTHAEVIDELETQLTSDTYRLTKMLMLVRSVGIGPSRCCVVSARTDNP